jgi:hypothetical protein
MANYVITGTQSAVPGSNKTVLSTFVTTGALKRGKVYDVLTGANGMPADNYLQWDISRMTVDGTGPAVTPNALESADAAALATAKNNYSVEPTRTWAVQGVHGGLVCRRRGHDRKRSGWAFDWACKLGLNDSLPLI